jgi:hypothetical protein
MATKRRMTFPFGSDARYIVGRIIVLTDLTKRVARAG